MTKVTSEELSALLDGELTDERAAVVRAATAADPALRAEYDALARLDAGLAELAEGTAFMPEIALPSSTSVPVAAATHRAIGVAVVATLLIVRLLPKFAELALLGVALQAVAAAAILIAVIALARDHRSMAYRPA